MAQWLVIGGSVMLVAGLVVLRRRMMDGSGPGRVGFAPKPWDGRERRGGDDKPAAR